MTDEQLRAAQLEIDDPMSLPNLRSGPPDQALTPEIVGEYHLADAELGVRCCHCPTKQKHQNGFAITNATGNVYLIGSTCGPTHYNLSFTQAKRQHSERVKRKNILTRIDLICACAQLIKDACSRILASDGLREVDLRRIALKRASGDAFFRLKAHVINGSPLTQSVRVRDYEAERQRDEFRDDDKPGEPIFKMEPRSLGSISGDEILKENGDCRDNVMALKRAIEAVELLARDTNTCSLTALTNAARAVESAYSSAQSAIVSAEAAPSFFGQDNISRLAAWSADYRDFRFLFGQDGLIVDDKKEGRLLINQIPPFRLERLPALSNPA